MTNHQTIPFLVSLPDESGQDTKGIFSADAEIRLQEIPIDRLKENLNNICQGLTTALSDIKKVGNFKLKEVTVGVEVNAEGGVNFVGTVKLGGKGAITLTFAED
ncbi:hypothetical protein MiHa_02158 [Microcystis aeruginosa NIES-2522]|uniref:Pepco domain-containing protein n=1 Tax=Microcystis aeruginosa TaxID=1126 RepID=UPI0012311853|nr:hypothetical protein [Microcystis aeruginosa]GCA84187.1 hypothetical protein MiHa_02158 [Microcystis aeruginosa NIES-2522]